MIIALAQDVKPSETPFALAFPKNLSPPTPSEDRQRIPPAQSLRGTRLAARCSLRRSYSGSRPSIHRSIDIRRISSQPEYRSALFCFCIRVCKWEECKCTHPRLFPRGDQLPSRSVPDSPSPVVLSKSEKKEVHAGHCQTVSSVVRMDKQMKIKRTETEAREAHLETLRREDTRLHGDPATTLTPG